MEKLPPQRRPGIIFNRLAAKCDDSDRTASKSRFESASKPEQFSFARGRLMETVLAYIKPAPCQIKPKDPMPFQYAPKSTSPTACQCYREKKNILCQACGHRFEGRVRTRCPIHPTVIHLMDLEACPNCLATHLKEFSTVTKRSQ